MVIESTREQILSCLPGWAGECDSFGAGKGVEDRGLTTQCFNQSFKDSSVDL